VSADHVLAQRVEALALDVARLRRLVADTRASFLVDRIAEHVRWLDVLVLPTAAELLSWGLTEERALELVDDRDAVIRRRLELKDGDA
jgi:hypothetical protein